MLYRSTIEEAAGEVALFDPRLERRFHHGMTVSNSVRKHGENNFSFLSLVPDRPLLSNQFDVIIPIGAVIPFVASRLTNWNTKPPRGGKSG